MPSLANSNEPAKIPAFPVRFKFLVDLNDIDRIETVSTEKSIEKSKSLAKDYGLFVGFSAAANFLVAERLIEEKYAKNIVTILCDRGERYFSCL